MPFTASLPKNIKIQQVTSENHLQPRKTLQEEQGENNRHDLFSPKHRHAPGKTRRPDQR